MNQIGPETTRPPGPSIRAPRLFACGLALVALALAAIYGSWSLRHGTPQSMGPGFFPRTLAIMIGLWGLGLSVAAFFRDGPPIERIAFRGPLLITAAIVLFGLTIRTFGLAIAGPISLLLAGLATPEFKLSHAVALAVGVTAFCILLFRVFLDLPMPILRLPALGLVY